MADTIAVMNAGRIEQLGSPAEIYELPRTVFVANFLGQSNLIAGERTGVLGDIVEVTAHGQVFGIPASRTSAPGVSVFVGVRPEKMTVVDLADEHQVPTGANRIRGRVSDVSYTGVSTQYLVVTDWGQELIAFEQNSKVGDRCAVGDPVILHWATEHTFGLDASAGADAGIAAEELRLRALNTELLGQA